MSDTVLGASDTRVIFACIHLVFKHLSFHFFHDFSKNHWHEVVLSTYSLRPGNF